MTVYQSRFRQAYLDKHDVALLICRILVSAVAIWLFVVMLMQIPAAIDAELAAVGATNYISVAKGGNP
jgi:hypothetical protein